jgi:hypothetical protein
VTHGGGNDVKVAGMRSKRRTNEEDEAQRCTVVEEARRRGEGLGARGHGPLLIVLRSFSHYDRQLHLLGDGRQLHLLDGVEQGGPCPEGGASREDKGGGRSSGGGGGGASGEDEGRETSNRIRIHVHVRDAAGDEEHHTGRSSGGKQ